MNKKDTHLSAFFELKQIVLQLYLRHESRVLHSDDLKCSRPSSPNMLANRYDLYQDYFQKHSL